MSSNSSKNLARVFSEAMSKVSTEAEAAATTKAFAQILIERSSLSKLGEILRRFSKIWDEKYGIIDVEITAADRNQAPHFQTIGKRTANVKVREDKSLIAGSVIKVGDYVLDQSVKGRINSLKNLVG